MRVLLVLSTGPLCGSAGTTRLQSTETEQPDIHNPQAVGAVKAIGFSAIAIDPATREAKLSVVICKAESLDEQEWNPVSTNDIPVKADTPTGFFFESPAVPPDLRGPPTL